MTERDFVFYMDSEQADFKVTCDWEMTLDAFGGDSEEAEATRLTSRLVSFATEFGLSGDLWSQWIAYLLIADENPLSLTCERHRINEDASICSLASEDFEKIFEIINADLSDIPDEGTAKKLALFRDYKPPYEREDGTHVGDLIRMLADELKEASNAAELAQAVTSYYERFGTGIYGLYRAFRIGGDGDFFEIVPVTDAEDVSFDILIGCDEQTATLRDNTEAFLKGLPANNVLLYGDSGTGKSTSVHALLSEYYEDGLRMVEVGKPDRPRLPELMAEIKKRSYKFIIFMDDLSFEEDESDYKELKAMLEGALEAGQDNVLIYATSNRRHLIRETWKDRNDMEFTEDVHRSDTMEEKLSLAGRFGLTIYYGKPDYKEYMRIVTAAAKRAGLEISGPELEAEARQWSIRHGSTSGRTASQLVKWMMRNKR